jgi:arginase
MVVAALTGHADREVLDLLPATTDASRVALVGMHDWTDPSLPPIAAEWGLTVFSPDSLRSSSAGLLDWVAATGATKIAIHFDVDTIDADEMRLGLGADRGGLTRAEASRVVADVAGAYDVVAVTVAEYVPRQVMHLQQLLARFPLIGPPRPLTGEPAHAGPPPRSHSPGRALHGAGPSRGGQRSSSMTSME